MKKILAIILITIAGSAFAQKQGIGIRLGNPLGLTYKKYIGRHAFEFGVGSAGKEWHDTYYRNTFESLKKFDDFDYRSHAVQSVVYLQGRYLLHNEIILNDMEGQWDWYWGIGAVLKAAKVRYRYDDNEPPFSDSEDHSDIDFGPEGIAGMEYIFQDVPIGVFAEVSLMLELADRITLQPFAGAGVRYNF